MSRRPDGDAALALAFLVVTLLGMAFCAAERMACDSPGEGLCFQETLK